MTETASNFTSGVLGSAWWYITRQGHTRQICRTTGFSLLFALKQALRDALVRTGPLPTSGGTTIAAEQIVQLRNDDNSLSGDGWTTDTLRGLYAVAQRARVSAVYTAAIQNDLQIGRLRPGRVLSTGTMQAAVWFAEESGSVGHETVDGESLQFTQYGAVGSPSEVSFGDNPVFPSFGTVPEVNADGSSGEATRICIPDVPTPGATTPLHAQARFSISDALILAGLVGTVTGLAFLSKGAPTREEQRQARRNPAIEAEALEDMTPARRRYAVATKSRDQLISLLKWHNPRGLYGDDERTHAGLYPLTQASAARLVHQQVGVA